MKIVEQLREMAGKERKHTVDFLRLLQVAEDERVFATYGFSSIYKLCTRDLKFSEGAAYRRISAMHLIRREKDWATKLESGELTLTNAAKLETALRVAEMRSIEVDAHALVESVFGMTSREADKKIEELGLKPEGKLPSVIEEKIEELKVLLGDPRASRQELLLLALEEAIAKRKPTLGDIAKEVRSPEKRHVPKKLKAAILNRAKHTCTYVSPITGMKCDAKYFLELDHVIPMAFGGKTEGKNLRVMCRTHNELAAKEAGLTWRKN